MMGIPIEERCTTCGLTRLAFGETDNPETYPMPCPKCETMTIRPVSTSKSRRIGEVWESKLKSPTVH
jgi:hypothetical protein